MVMSCEVNIQSIYVLNYTHTCNMMDGQSSPETVTEISVADLWAAILRMPAKGGSRWNGVTQSELEQWFNKKSDSIDVLCNVFGSSPSYSEVSKCTIYPSRTEMIHAQYTSHSWPMRKNACITIYYTKGGVTNHDLKSTGWENTLSTVLAPALRSPMFSPKPTVIQKIDLNDICTSKDQIFDFMTYYELNYNRTGQEDRVQIDVVGKKRYKVVINPFQQTSADSGNIHAAVTTYEDESRPRAFPFTTGRELVTALGSVGIQVNTDISDYRKVERLRGQLNPFKSSDQEIGLNAAMVKVFNVLDNLVVLL